VRVCGRDGGVLAGDVRMSVTDWLRARAEAVAPAGDDRIDGIVARAMKGALELAADAYDAEHPAQEAPRCVSCDKPLPVACPDCIDYALDATRAPREADTLRAQLAELVEAERSVTWYDWSDNDEDAVESIDRLRSALARAEAVLEKGKR